MHRVEKHSESYAKQSTDFDNISYKCLVWTHDQLRKLAATFNDFLLVIIYEIN